MAFIFFQIISIQTKRPNQLLTQSPRWERDFSLITSKIAGLKCCDSWPRVLHLKLTRAHIMIPAMAVSTMVTASNGQAFSTASNTTLNALESSSVVIKLCPRIIIEFEKWKFTVLLTRWVLEYWNSNVDFVLSQEFHHFKLAA